MVEIQYVPRQCELNNWLIYSYEGNRLWLSFHVMTNFVSFQFYLDIDEFVEFKLHHLAFFVPVQFCFLFIWPNKNLCVYIEHHQLFYYYCIDILWIYFDPESLKRDDFFYSSLSIVIQNSLNKVVLVMLSVHLVNYWKLSDFRPLSSFCIFQKHKKISLSDDSWR